jgi:hypothetical protein
MEGEEYRAGRRAPEVAIGGREKGSLTQMRVVIGIV